MYKSVKSMINNTEKKDNVEGSGVQLNTDEKNKKKKKCC
jgi:hypothetical protein